MGRHGRSRASELELLAEPVGAVLPRATVPLFRCALPGARGWFDPAAEQIAAGAAGWIGCLRPCVCDLRCV